jgi:hypothetical protein
MDTEKYTEIGKEILKDIYSLKSEGIEWK